MCTQSTAYVSRNTVKIEMAFADAQRIQQNDDASRESRPRNLYPAVRFGCLGVDRSGVRKHVTIKHNLDSADVVEVLMPTGSSILLIL